MDNKNKMNDEELNNVTGGIHHSKRKTNYGISKLIGKCECHPDGVCEGYHEYVLTGNKERRFGIFETNELKCKYCGKTSTDWSLALGILGGRY